MMVCPRRVGLSSHTQGTISAKFPEFESREGSLEPL